MMGDSLEDQEFLEISGIKSTPGPSLILDTERFPILKGMSSVHLRILESASRIMHVCEGVEVLFEGDASHDLFFIHSGKVAIGRRQGNQLSVIAHRYPGDIYGEFGVLRGKARQASVFTIEPSRIIRVELSAAQQVLEVDKEFRDKLEQLLRRRMLESFFSSHPVFQDIPVANRNKLVESLEIEVAKRRARIFNQNDPPKGIYMVLSGEIEILLRNNKGEEVLIELRRDGEILGEVAHGGGKGMAYSALATSNVDLLKLDKRGLKVLQNEHEPTYKALTAFIGKRAEKTALRLKANL